jgi:hypothetical protein
VCIDKVLSLPQKAQEGYHCSHTSRSAGEAQSRARCAQASWGLRTYQLRLKGEGLLLQRVHRVEESNNQELFERLLQGVRAGVLLRLEFASESSGGSAPLKYSKGDGGEIIIAQKLISEGRTSIRLAEVIEK